MIRTIIIALTISIIPMVTFAQNESSSVPVKIVTWNIGMLPNFGIGQFFSKHIRTQRPQRAKEILKYFQKHNDFDVIVFQEVFDQDICRKLTREFRKMGYTEHVLPIKTKRLVNSGILIVSKHKLTKTNHIVFDKGLRADKKASKGCTLVACEIRGSTFQIAGTHLQSYPGKLRDSVRAIQYDDIHQFIKKNHKENQAVFIMGDMNTNKLHTKRYDLMVNTIMAKDIQPQGNIQYTFVGRKGRSKIYFDYILVQKRKFKIKVIKSYVMRPTYNKGGKEKDYSDHLPVVAEFLIIK